MSVSLQQLEFFRAVARNLSFSNAAKQLYTSQPYVSNQIRRLEDHFGVPLFVRSHPQIALTEAGQALLERIDRILDDVDELDQVVQQFHGLHRGTVQVAATASAGNHVLPELIASFHREWPDVVIQARIGNTEDVLRWIDLDEVEVGICPRRPTGSDLTAEPFYREALVVLHPAGMRLSDPVTSEQLRDLPKVVREDGSLTLARMREVLGDFDFVAQVGGTTAVNEAVAAGLGISLVPERSAKAWLDAGLVGACRLADATLEHEFFVIYAQERYVPPAALAFIAHLRAAG